MQNEKNGWLQNYFSALRYGDIFKDFFDSAFEAVDSRINFSQHIDYSRPYNLYKFIDAVLCFSSYRDLQYGIGRDQATIQGIKKSAETTWKLKKGWIEFFVTALDNIYQSWSKVLEKFRERQYTELLLRWRASNSLSEKLQDKIFFAKAREELSDILYEDKIGKLIKMHTEINKDLRKEKKKGKMLMQERRLRIHEFINKEFNIKFLDSVTVEEIFRDLDFLKNYFKGQLAELVVTYVYMSNRILLLPFGPMQHGLSKTGQSGPELGDFIDVSRHTLVNVKSYYQKNTDSLVKMYLSTGLRATFAVPRYSIIDDKYIVVDMLRPSAWSKSADYEPCIHYSEGLGYDIKILREITESFKSDQRLGSWRKKAEKKEDIIVGNTD